MKSPQVHIIKHDADTTRCYSVYDEETRVLMSKLTQKQAEQIANTLTGEVVYHDATKVEHPA